MRDVVRRPDHYGKIVARVRRHMAEHHSYEARLRELVQLIND